MSAVILGLEADTDDPLANEAGILPRAHVPHIIVTAWENEVVQGAAATLKPSEQGLAGWLDNFELDRAFGLLLHYDGAIPVPAASDYVTDAHLDDVAAAQLAIDRKVEKCSVPEAPVLVKPKSDGPNLLRFTGALCAPYKALIPGAEFMKSAPSHISTGSR